jgi:hypothetical protein
MGICSLETDSESRSGKYIKSNGVQEIVLFGNLFSPKDIVLRALIDLDETGS